MRTPEARTPAGSPAAMPWRRRTRAAALLLGVAVCGCSTYAWRAQEIRPLVRSQKYADALVKLEPLRDGGSRLLYLYERGLILHYENRFEDSNAELESAELLLDDLYTRSLTREAGALVTSDNLVEYRGERFEAAFVHYYKTMNYLQLGQVEEAAVECRRLNLRLQQYRDEPSGSYTDDPFLQYLTGMVYEQAGQHTDANVSYRLSLEAYHGLSSSLGVDLPARLLCDLSQNAARLGDRDEAERYATEGGCTVGGERRRVTTGSLQLFLECGYVPFKKQTDFLLPILENEITDDLDRDAYCAGLLERREWNASRRAKLKVEYWLRVAVPELVPTPSGIEYARVRTVVGADTLQVYSVVGSDLSHLARVAFEERQGKILLRTVTRAFLKYLASRQAKQKSGEVAGFLVNLLGAASESADTRAWSTLPEKVLFAPLDLPPGTHQIEVDLFDRAGRRSDSFRIPDVRIDVERATFLNHRVF